MAKTDKQRLLIYKAVNRLRNREITKHSRVIAKALDTSIEPLLKRVGFMQQYNDAMLNLIDEQPLKEAIRNIYETTGKTFARASERKLTKQVKKEFTDFTWSNKINALLNDNSEGGLGMLITNMNDYTKKLIAADVKNALDSGVGIGDLAGFLSSKYSKDVNRMRGLRIGRTETIKASNYGSLQGAYASGVEFVKEWNSIGDSRTRGSHRSIDGKQALQDEAFNVGGYKMLHPADSSLGAAAKEVVNCRCVIDFVPPEEYDIANSTNAVGTGGGAEVNINMSLSELNDVYSNKYKVPVNFKNIDADIVREQMAQFDKLYNEYNIEDLVEISEQSRGVDVAASVFRVSNDKKCILYLNPNKFRLSKSGVKMYSHNVDEFAAYTVRNITNHSLDVGANNHLATITHEFAHIFGSPKQGRTYNFTEYAEWGKKIEAIKRRYTKALNKIELDYFAGKIKEVDYKRLKKDIWISDYAKTNSDEFMAESFAMFKLSNNPSPYAVEVGELLNKYYLK